MSIRTVPPAVFLLLKGHTCHVIWHVFLQSRYLGERGKKEREKERERERERTK